MSLSPIIRGLFFFVFGGKSVFAAEAVATWRDVSRYDFDPAHTTFRQDTGPEARLGEAVTLLNLQPRTEANINQAATLLDAVAAGESGDVGLCARYLRARIEEVHRPVPQPAEAIRLYQELIRQGGSHPLAQQAAVRLALLKLYPGAVATSPEDRVAAAEAVGAGLTDPGAIRDHALLVGRACLFYHLPLDRAQRHLERAWAAGVLNPATRADLLVTLGEIGRERGDKIGAARYYRLYLEENPRADRSAAVRRRLGEVTGNSS